MSEFVMVKRELLEYAIATVTASWGPGNLTDALRDVLAQEAGPGEAVAWGAWRKSMNRFHYIEGNQDYMERTYGKTSEDYGTDFELVPLYRHPTSPPAPVSLASLRNFANAMIDIALEGSDADVAHIQELAVKHGLLNPEQRTERCGDSCSCAEYADFPVECFRKAKELNQ